MDENGNMTGFFDIDSLLDELEQQDHQLGQRLSNSPVEPQVNRSANAQTIEDAQSDSKVTVNIESLAEQIEKLQKDDPEKTTEIPNLPVEQDLINFDDEVSVVQNETVLPDPAVACTAQVELPQAINLLDNDLPWESQQTVTLLGIIKPEWVEDSVSDECMKCNLPFNFIRRRHHCRCCGLLFCRGCCNASFYLDYLAKTDRVCLTCLAELVRLSENKSTAVNNHHSSSPTKKPEKLPESILTLLPKSDKDPSRSVRFSDGISQIKPEFTEPVTLPKPPLIKRHRLKLLQTNPENASTLCLPPVVELENGVDESISKEVGLSLAAERLTLEMVDMESVDGGEDLEISSSIVKFELTKNLQAKVKKVVDISRSDGKKCNVYWEMESVGVNKLLHGYDFKVKIPILEENLEKETLPTKFIFNWFLQLWNCTKENSMSLVPFSFQKFKIPQAFGESWPYFGCVWFPHALHHIESYLLLEDELTWLTSSSSDNKIPSFLPHCLLHLTTSSPPSPTNRKLTCNPLSTSSFKSANKKLTFNESTPCIPLSDTNLCLETTESDIISLNISFNPRFLMKITSIVTVDKLISQLCFYFATSKKFLIIQSSKTQSVVDISVFTYMEKNIGYVIDINEYMYPTVFHQLFTGCNCVLENFTLKFIQHSTVVDDSNIFYVPFPYTFHKRKTRKSSQIEVKYYAIKKSKHGDQAEGNTRFTEIPSEVLLEEFTSNIKQLLENTCIKLPTTIDILENFGSSKDEENQEFVDSVNAFLASEVIIYCDFTLSILDSDFQDWSY